LEENLLQCQFVHHKINMARPVFYVKPFRKSFMLEKGWQYKYIYRNIEARWCNYGCIRKSVIVIFSQRVIVARYAIRMDHNVFCDLSASKIIFNLIFKRHDFQEKVI
jgi:hypothetical protein